MDRKSLMQSVILIARQPDQGNNLHLAMLKIEEFLKPIALNKAAQRAELEWMEEEVIRQKRDDPTVSKLFESLQDLIEVHLRKLDEEEPEP